VTFTSTEVRRKTGADSRACVLSCGNVELVADEPDVTVNLWYHDGTFVAKEAGCAKQVDVKFAP